MSKILLNFATKLSNVFENKRVRAYIVALVIITVGYAANVTIQCINGSVVYEPPFGSFIVQFMLFCYYLWKDERDAKKNSAEESLG